MRRTDDFTSIGSFLKEGIFAIPEYQRDFAWGIKDCETLSDDVFRLYWDSTEKHYLGSIVVMQLDEKFVSHFSEQGNPQNIIADNVTRYHVVDGQQRLTACSVFLCAIRDLIQAEGIEVFETEIRIKTKDDLIRRVTDCLENYSAVIDDNYAPRLFLNNDSAIQYQSILRECSLPSRGRKLTNAYKCFKSIIISKKNEICSESVNAPDFYYRLINALLEQLVIDDVCCDDFGSAFQIFESINAKGQPLSSVDLIKCYLMQKGQDNITDARVRWNKLLETVDSSPDNSQNLERFMGAFLFTACGRRVSKAKAYQEFESLYSESSYAEIFRDLQVAAEFYKLMTTEQPEWESGDAFFAFKALKLTQVYVPLLAASRFYENGINSVEFKELKEALKPFAFKYQICGRSSNALDDKFKSMIENIKNQSSIRDVLSVLTQITPSPDEFREGFRQLVFKDSEEQLATYILKEIEIFLERKNLSEKNLPQNVSLEHIIPKEYSDYISEWDEVTLPTDFDTDVVRSIGNMVLISPPDNSAARNYPYTRKISVYLDGNRNTDNSPAFSYNLVERLLNDYPSVFSQQDVDDRAKELANYAVVVWD